MDIIRGKVDCRPEEVNYDSSRIEVLNAHLTRLIEQQKIDGSSYCILKDGQIIANNSIGTAHLCDKDVAMQPDTIHEIASITKMFTAVAIMKLIEDGYARLDVRVGDILPQMAVVPFNEITLFHLLTHTSGLHPDGGCFENPYFVSPWDYIGNAYHNLKEGETFDWLKEGLKCRMREKPDTQWMYCSFGFVILGEVIAKLSGMRAEEYIMKNIIMPLGMKDTGFYGNLTVERAKRLNVIDGEDKTQLQDFITGKEQKPSMWENIPGTGGGLHSTPYDLIQFANMLLHNGTINDIRIIGRKTLEKMTTCQLHNIPDYCWNSKVKDRKYGIGFDMREGSAFHYSTGSYMHEGWGSCSLDVDPKENIAMAWTVPYNKQQWYAEGLYNIVNIVWSGIK